MKSEHILLGLGALWLIARSPPSPAAPPSSGLTAAQTTQVMQNPLASGSYSNEQQLAQAILSAPNAEAALAAALSTVSAPMPFDTTDESFGSPYDLARITGDNANFNDAHTGGEKNIVTQRVYDLQAKLLGQYQEKAAYARGERASYFAELARQAQAALNDMRVFT